MPSWQQSGILMVEVEIRAMSASEPGNVQIVAPRRVLGCRSCTGSNLSKLEHALIGSYSLIWQHRICKC